MELFNDEESEVCQGSEVSEDNAQRAHAKNEINLGNNWFK